MRRECQLPLSSELHLSLQEHTSAQTLWITSLTLGQSLQYHWPTRIPAQNNSGSMTAIPPSSGRSPFQTRTGTEVPTSVNSNKSVLLLFCEVPLTLLQPHMP